jgi:hypothetical protein
MMHYSYYADYYALLSEGREPMKSVDLTAHNGHIHEFTEQEAVDLFDARARYYLEISGDEFLAKWRIGAYEGRMEDSNVVAVAMLLPLVDPDVRRAGL